MTLIRGKIGGPMTLSQRFPWVHAPESLGQNTESSSSRRMPGSSQGRVEALDPGVRRADGGNVDACHGEAIFGGRRIRTVLLAGACVAVALPGCANRATSPQARQSLIVQTTVNGKISQDPRVRYMVVLNVSGINDGPKLFGPWVFVNPQVGWDFPFYLGSDTPQASTLLSAQTPPVVLEPQIWTDAFVLSNVAGTETVQHWTRSNQPGTEIQTGITRQTDLAQNVDWNLTSSLGGGVGSSAPLDTWQLNLPLTTYGLDKLGTTQVNANLVVQQIPPANADYHQVGLTGPNGWIIDQWNQAPNVYVSFSLDPSRGLVMQTSPHAGTPVFPTNVPSGMTQDDVTLKAYTTQVKTF